MPDTKSSDSEAVPDDQTLELRVEAIMDGSQPAASPANASPPPIDILSDPKTAPKVSAKLLKQIQQNAKEEPADPDVPIEVPKPETTASAPTEATPVEPVKDADGLDDSVIDKAVDEIVAKEADTVLAAVDAASGQAAIKPEKALKISRRSSLLKRKWLWTVMALVLVIAAAFGVPMTRYKLIGLILKEPLKVTVIDSKTKTPVSNAVVRLDGKTAKTDAGGRASLSVLPGQSTLAVSKQYYEAYTHAHFTGFTSGKTIAVQLQATGRQVPIVVRNFITGKPLGGVDISVLDTTAKTNQQGQATIVLPTTAVSDTAQFSLSGYNTAHDDIEVTSAIVGANAISLTPAGHIYFLSNLSGTIDVVKANLDGSGRQTVFAGTGKEDPNTTSLLASRDWQYLVLKAQRDSGKPALYLINTSNDKVTQFDSGNAEFTLIGWYGHDFMYDVVHDGVPNWQTGHESLKSYDADTGVTNQLDQSQAQGSADAYAYQGFYNYYIVDGQIVYNTQWYTYNASGTGYSLDGKSDTIRGVQPDAQGKKDYQSIPAANVGNIQAEPFEPQGIYYEVYNYSTNVTAYYKFEEGAVSTISSPGVNAFAQTYPTYLVSPSGSQTFWTELRDGQNTLFVGDQNAQSQKQVASLNGYTPYGWFSDRYLLVSQNSSQLYIMPASGLASGKQPLKITDYYKPAQTYNGYGYGYGGL